MAREDLWAELGYFLHKSPQFPDYLVTTHHLNVKELNGITKVAHKTCIFLSAWLMGNKLLLAQDHVAQT